MGNVEAKLEFKELGLTQNESKVYETLIRFGNTTAAHLSKESSVPYGRIYNVLESLEEKGLIRVIPDSTKKYSAADPAKLQEIIDNKIKNLMSINDEIKNYKKLYDDNTKEPVLLTKGKSNFIKIVREMSHVKQTRYTIRYAFDPNPEFIRNTKILQKKDVDIKQLGRLDSETKDNIREWSKVIDVGRQIPNEGIALEIVDDEEVMIALIKSNTTLLIRDKPFAKLMKELFIKYYIQAPPLLPDEKKGL